MANFVDIRGQRFGRLVAIEPIHDRKVLKWICRCDCGNSTITTYSKLKSGRTRSCGCLQREKTSEASKKDYTGCRFGRLVVECRLPEKRAKYLCVCDCGAAVIVEGSNLVSGATKSCGCLRSEVASKRSTKHGGCGTRLYRVWSNMIDRCENPNNKEYNRYGGRGIDICFEWRQDFSKFMEWALENGYKENLTIDRINNELGYCPSNCQWITREENSAKMKQDKMLESKK